jgi:hypothetical protein
MKNSRLSIALVTLLAFIIIGFALNNLGHAGNSSAQDADKSLDIERYPNEPLELTELKVRENSVKKGIRFKSKDNISQWGLDNVKFKEKDDWVKSLTIRLRNVSSLPIYSLSASLYLKHPNLRKLYRTSLKQKQTRDLKKVPLQPGDEIDLEVDEAELNNTMTNMRQDGVDPNGTPVSLSVDNAMFSNDFQWSRGSYMRRDPSQPNKWDAADKPTSLGASWSKPAGFNLISFQPIAPRLQGSACQSAKTGRIGYPCSEENCWWFVETGPGTPGNLTAFETAGICRDSDDHASSCAANTTHYRFGIDSSCPTPSPSPTPTPCLGAFDGPCGLDTDCCPTTLGLHCNWDLPPPEQKVCYPNYTRCTSPAEQHEQDWCNQYGGRMNTNCQCVDYIAGNGGYDYGHGPGSPIVIDVAGNGFSFTVVLRESPLTSTSMGRLNTCLGLLPAPMKPG